MELNITQNATNTPSGLECTEGDLTNPLSLMLQGLLGLIAFAFLIIKRQLEPANIRRSWFVWLCDSSKQGWSMAIIHVANVALCESSHGSVSQVDPCTCYFSVFGLDTTIGLVFIWIGIKSLECCCTRLNWLDGLEFGVYFRPNKSKRKSRSRQNSRNRTLPTQPSVSEMQERQRIKNFSVHTYVVQVACFIIVAMMLKVLVWGLLQLRFIDQVFVHAMQLIGRITWDKNSEIALVIFILPLIMNCIMFWVVDSILMKGSSCLDVLKNVLLCRRNPTDIDKNEPIKRFRT